MNKMKKTKMEKGITLVALIITIIVLLILAVVSIRAVTGDEIIDYAKKAKSDYEQAQANEKALLENILNDLAGENENLPEFVDSIEQCIDINKKYVLPDGYLYEYKPIQVADFTNLADPTNEEWLTDIRLSYTTTSELDGATTTNIFSAKAGDIIRIKGLDLGYNVVFPSTCPRMHLINNNIVVAGDFYPYKIVSHGYGSIDEDVYTFTLVNDDGSEFTDAFNNIRLCGVITGNAEDVIITVNEELTWSSSTSEFAWQKTEKYIPADWYTEVKSTATYVKNLKANTGSDAVQFLLSSDIHFPDQANVQNIGKVSAEVMRECNIQFFMNLGDNTPDAFNTDKPDYLSYMNSILDILAPIGRKNILSTVGNHDGATGEKIVDGERVHFGYELNNEERAEVYFGWQRSNTDKKFGPDGTYYYIDDSSSKIRYIMLNSFWTEWGGDENGFVTDRQHSFYYVPMFGKEQLTWFSDEALSMPEGYIAIIGTHGATADYLPQIDLGIFKGIVSAFVNKTQYLDSFTGTQDWQSYSISADFTDEKGELIAIFHGHEHKDSIDTTSFAVPFIGITSAQKNARDEDAPTRTVGTATETAIDVVTINRTNRTINLTRLGVGDDRSVSY